MADNFSPAGSQTVEDQPQTAGAPGDSQVAAEVDIKRQLEVKPSPDQVADALVGIELETKYRGGAGQKPVAAPPGPQAPKDQASPAAAAQNPAEQPLVAPRPIKAPPQPQPQEEQPAVGPKNLRGEPKISPPRPLVPKAAPSPSSDGGAGQNPNIFSKLNLPAIREQTGQALDTQAEQAALEGSPPEEEEPPEELVGPALSQELPGVRKKKLDAEVKQIMETVNKALDTFLLGIAESIWVAALPSFTVSVWLGGLVGSFLWAFKNKLIQRFLRPFLRTEALKQQAEEITKQIKFSLKVKINIILMDLVIALEVIVVILFVLAFLYVGCNYPPKVSNWGGYHYGSILGNPAVGGEKVCEALDGVSKSGQ